MSGFWIRLRHNWFRNLLAVLQVAIAIAAVGAVFIDVLPTLQTDDGGGSTRYTVRFGARTAMGGAMWSGVFTTEDVGFLLEHATAIEAASAYERQFQPIVRVGDERYMLRGIGRVHASFDRLMDLDITAGSFFVEDDVLSEAPRVAVISEELARLLYGDAPDALGQVVNVRPEEEGHAVRGFPSSDMLASALAQPGDDVQIIGIFTRGAEGGLTAAFGPVLNEVMLLPARATPEGNTSRRSAEIFVRAKPGMDQEAEEEVKALLMARLEERGDADRMMDGVSLDIMVEPMMAGSALREARLINALVFGALGLAALVVSAIAMFTTTLANLTQRTRYIGLGRALGATQGRVLREVVAETALLAGIGGAIGAAAAFPLRATVLAPLFIVGGGGAPGVTDILFVALAGIGLAVVVGGLAGLYPAWTVARLAPAEAWREGHM